MENNETNKGSKENELNEKLLYAEFEALFNESGNDDFKNLNVENKQKENDELLKKEDLVDDVNEAAIDKNKKINNDDLEIEEFLNDHRAFLKLKEEEKEKKYYVEPVEPWKDFSEHGDFAIAMEAGQESEYREYLKKVEEMKKKRIEDERLEKIREKVKKDEIANQIKKEKLLKKLNTLNNKINKLGMEGITVDFNDKMKWIQIKSFRPFYKVVDHSGNVIISAEFIQISSKERAFYYYDRCEKTYKFYKWDATDSRFTLDHKCEKQTDLWLYISNNYPIDKFGFTFLRNPNK